MSDKYAGDWKLIHQYTFDDNHQWIPQTEAEMIAAAGDDEDEIRSIRKAFAAILCITPELKMIQKIPVPPGTSKEELEEEGLTLDENGMACMADPSELKVEDGELYIKVPENMCEGEQWEKLSTPEGTLKFVKIMEYAKI